jgi:ribosome-associated translation inhibitor RaiA
MSNGAPSGVSMSEVRNAIDSAIGPLNRQIDRLEREQNELRNYINSEIERLEREMREIGEMIVTAIERQTQAVVGGVAATTLMIERTKSQIQTDFQETRNKLEIQTESTLQIEVGKKVSEATSLKSKLAAFAEDIRGRFDKSIENAAINRELYNLNFRKIRDEYENKMQTIGEHIFQIKFEDIAPAEKAAMVPYEDAHSLPLEMDLQRLSVRSQNLDETLNLLKSSRLDDVVSSLDNLQNLLASHSIGENIPGGEVKLCVEGLVTSSSVQTRVVAGCMAHSPEQEGNIHIALADKSLSFYNSQNVSDRIGQSLGALNPSNVEGEEIVSLSRASDSLLQRELISKEAHALFQDFLASDKLKKVEV